MDENQLEQYSVDEFAKLERAYGGEDKLQEKLRAAAVMIDVLDQKQPGLKNLLRSKGIGDSALARSPQRALRCRPARFSLRAGSPSRKK